MEAYEPRCSLRGRLYMFPKRDASQGAGNDLEQRLTKLGCTPDVCQPGVKCADMNTKYDQFLGGPPNL